jgi:uncharacterized delta-60 repeat protein
MKRGLQAVTALFFVIVCLDCPNPLRRSFNNPVDPDSDTYIGYPSEDNDGDGIPQYEDVDEIVLLSPPNGATIKKMPLMLITSIFDPAKVKKYWIQIATSNNDFDGSTIFSEDDYVVNNCVLPPGFVEENNTYYWRAKAFDGSKWSQNWSKIRSFIVDIEWSVSMGGIASDGGDGRGVQLQNGGFAAIGTTFSFGAGSSDFMLACLRADGSLEWCKCYGGTGYDLPTAMRATNDGSLIICGNTNSFGTGASDFWILKLNSDGSVCWEKAYGGGTEDELTDICQTNDGGYIVVGTARSIGSAKSDIIILRLASNGTVQWTRAVHDADITLAHSVKETSDGGFVVAGTKYGFNSIYGDWYILRLSSDGSIVWQKTYSGPYYDFAASVAQTNDKGYLVVGTMQIDFGNDDIVLLRLDENGAVNWGKRFIGSDDEGLVYNYSVGADTLCVLNDESALVVGITDSFGAGESDGLALRLAANGDVIWSRTYGGELSDAFHSAISTSDGEFLITGHTRSFGEKDLDLWVLRINSDGTCGNLGIIQTLEIQNYITSVTDRNLASNECGFSVTDTSCYVNAAPVTTFWQVP